jgi:hypothetical protein
MHARQVGVAMDSEKNSANGCVEMNMVERVGKKGSAKRVKLKHPVECKLFHCLLKWRDILNFRNIKGWQNSIGFRNLGLQQNHPMRKWSRLLFRTFHFHLFMWF